MRLLCHLRFWVTLCCAFALAALFLSAQMSLAQDRPTEDPASTLHVYVNLIQVPVLLLDSSRHPRRPVPPSRFLLSLQGQPPFHPRHVRIEGDDPIALALLVDAGNPHDPLWQKLPEMLGPLMEGLRKSDTVELYALDGCALRKFGDASGPDGALLQSRVKEAVSIKPYASRATEPGSCRNRVALWDAMRYITVQLSTRNARRVLLMVTGGQPPMGSDAMLKLGQVMDSASVAAFAVAQEDDSSGTGYSNGLTRNLGFSADKLAAMTRNVSTSASALAQQCEMSGGMVLYTRPQNLAKTLGQTISLVRGRYIVEFPRPSGLGAGAYQLEVSIGDRFAFIRPSGGSAPIAEEKETRDPTVEQGVSNPDAPTPATPPVPDASSQTPVK